MIVYERIEPEARCVSPDGHDCIEIFAMRSSVPTDVVCPTCAQPWTIVTFEDEGVSAND